MKTVVIYARHSSDKQVTSTHDQIERCKNYCATKGYKVIAVYYDEAISGAIPIKHRKGIQNLFDLAVQESFEIIICEDLSRLSRDQGDIAHFYKKMMFLDIEIETITEGTINELHIGLKGTMNALYLKDLGDKTRRGMIASVLKGAVPGGRTYGYDLVQAISEGEIIRGMRSINTEQAAVVRQIFKWYLEGKSTYEICDTLNKQAIPSAKGGQWRMTTLVGTRSRKTGLLRQTLYKGEITFNRMAYKKHPKTGKRVSIPRPESEWMSIPIPELAIITVEDFDTVQKMIEEKAENRRTKINKKEYKSVEESRQDNKADVRKWRARQYRPNAYNQYITTRRLFCTHCQENITSYKGQADRCKNRDCSEHTSIKREYSTEKTLQRLKAITLDEILKFNELPTDKLTLEKKQLEADLERKREVIRELLEQVGIQERRGSETMIFLTEKEKECQGLRYRIARTDKKLKALRPVTERQASLIKRQFLALLQEYEKDKYNEQRVREIQRFIKRIHVTHYNHYQIEYDLEELVKTFR